MDGNKTVGVTGERSWLEWFSTRARAGAREAGEAADAISFQPSFFILGPPRTGTSWLHEILRGRAILPSSAKETRFFDSHFHRGMDWYRAHYPKTIGGRSIGEVAPTYFASAEARERIAKLFPQARVVCIFRNPVERVLSLYRVKRAYGMIPWSFEQSLLNDPELTDTSRYASNLKAWQRALGPERVLPTVYDDLWINPQSYLDSVVDFIGIPRFVLTSQQYRSVHSSDGLTHPRSYMRTRSATKIADWLKAQRLDPVVAFVRNSRLRRLFLGGGAPFADLAPDLVTRLYEHFRDEVEQLEDMLRRDFSAWKGRSMGSSTKSQYPA